MVDNQSILFIDDEKILCETVSDDLEEIGYSVTTATCGNEAITIFKKDLHDIVITDLIMEDKNGIEVAREIKKIKPNTPVIILTGHGSMETAIQALHLEVQDYVLKPVNRNDLARKVEQCLKKRKNGSSPVDIKPAYNQELKFKEARLTRREREVALLAGEGYSDDEIANMLIISVYTVKFHLKKVFKKLGIHKRVELVVSMGK